MFRSTGGGGEGERREERREEGRETVARGGAACDGIISVHLSVCPLGIGGVPERIEALLQRHHRARTLLLRLPYDAVGALTQPGKERGAREKVSQRLLCN